jgi:probable FeS assembly SUF system protein SufT
MNTPAAGSELYGELVVEHKRAPRNFGTLAAPTHRAHGHNPQCGDDLEVQLELDAGQLRDIRFHGQGCAICIASASMMSEAVKGRSVAHAAQLQQRFRAVLTGQLEADAAEARIAQDRGASFTLVVQGQMVRLEGKDADAIGMPVPQTIAIPADAGVRDVPQLVWQLLRTCYDPEIPVDIVELGLVYEVDVSAMPHGKQRVRIRMTLTAPGCGMGEVLADEICDKVLTLPHVGEATVDVVFDPPWDRSRRSEAALLALGL